MCMTVAEAVSARSTCKRLHVGSLLVSEDYYRVYAFSYNGSVRKQKHKCNAKLEGACGCVHSEANLLRNVSSYDGLKKVLFTTVSPCLECAKAIANCGYVTKVFYKYPYRSTKGLAVLRKSKITVKRMK